MKDAALVSDAYRRFAEVECKNYSDAYYRLALAVSEDDEVIDFIAQMPVIQPNLFFASVQLLTGPERMPTGGSELRSFLKRNNRKVAELMHSHRTQTNEVGRCAVLLPALPPGPLALIEVGASAGLCLLLDRYHYDFGSTKIGDSSSPVHLRCEVSGSVNFPPAIPHVVWRRGLDLQPNRVDDEDAVRWLLACVWPDHHERRQRLEKAIDLARVDPAEVIAGDLTTDLPGLLAEAPQNAQLVVFHSVVLSYVSKEGRRAFADALVDASKQRDIVWISNEPPGVVPEITALAPPVNDLRFLLGRTRLRQGNRTDEPLALAHPHGSHFTWLEARNGPPGH